MKSVLALLVLAPGLARADKTIDATRGTWDCGKDPVVHIRHGHGHYRLTGKCKTVNVDGGYDAVTVARVDALNIRGAHNTVDVGTLGTVTLLGTDNRITWRHAAKGAHPKVNDLGSRNTVAAAPRKHRPTPPGPTPPAPLRPTPVGTLVDCAKQPTTVIGHDERHYRFVGRCKLITINSDDNHVTIQRVERLAIRGDDNHVDVGAAARIAVAGDDNHVSYKKGLHRARPRIAVSGDNNKIRRAR